MSKYLTTKLKNQIAVIFSILAIWFFLSQLEWALKSPANLWFAEISETFKALWKIIISEYNHIGWSFFRVFLSAFIAIFSGTLIGILIGYFDKLYDSIKLPIDFWRSTPPIIVIPILYRWDPSGSDEYYWRIMLVLFGCLPIMIMMIADAINSSSKKRLIIFQSLNTGFWFKIRNVVLYEILPNIFSGTRTIISFAVIIIIVSEMIYSPTEGIGTQIIRYQIAYEIQFVYGYAFLVGLIGIILNILIRYIENKVITWM